MYRFMSMISIVNSIHTYPYAQRSLYYKKNLERHPAFCGRLFAGSCTPRHCTELDARPRFQARRHPWICTSIDQKVALLFSPFEIKTTQAGIGPYTGFWTPKSFGSRRRALASVEESQNSFSTLWTDTHGVDCDCPSCQRVKEPLRRGLERLAWTVPGFRRLARALAWVQRG